MRGWRGMANSLPPRRICVKSKERPLHDEISVSYYQGEDVARKKRRSEPGDWVSVKSKNPPTATVLVKTGDQLVRFVELSMTQPRPAPLKPRS